MAKDYDDNPPIPRFIDRPKMVGIFEVDEIAVGGIVFLIIFFAGFALGITTALAMPLGLLLMLISAKLVSSFKKNYPDGAIRQVLYRKGYYDPVVDRINKQRKDILRGNKVYPTGYLNYFIH